MIEKFFTTEQVANILQVHPFTILKFIKQGKLNGIKLGRVYRIKESDVKDFLENASSKVKRATTTPQTVKHEELRIDADSKPDNDNQEHYYII